MAAESAGVPRVFEQMLINPAQCEKQLAATLHAWRGPGKLRMLTAAMDKWQLFLPAKCGKELATASFLRILHRCVYGSEDACNALLGCQPFVEVLLNQVRHVSSASYLPPLLWLLQGLTATSFRAQSAVFSHPRLLETLLFRAVQKTSLVSVACATLMYNVIHCRDDLVASLKQSAALLSHEPSRQFADGLLKHLSPVVIERTPAVDATAVATDDAAPAIAEDAATTPFAVLESLPSLDESIPPAVPLPEVVSVPVFDKETQDLVNRAAVLLQNRGAVLKPTPSNFEANLAKLCACKDYPDVFTFGYRDVVDAHALHIKDVSDLCTFRSMV
jgi:hypothetical protein